jgi:cytochrome c oxidase assembly protein subunit 15
MLEADPAPLATPDRARSRLALSPSVYRRIVLAALVLLGTIVVTGAAVRLSGSGLGCSSWPNCEPEEFIAVGDPNQAIEQVNRLFTGLVSVAVIAAVLGAMRRVPYRRDLVWLAWGLVAGVIGQILLGGVTVLSHLHPVAVAGHFVLSQVLVVDATVLLWRAGSPERSTPDTAAARPAGPRVRRAGWAAMVLGAVVVAVSGPVLSGAGPHAGDDWDAVRRFQLPIPDAARIHSLSAWAFLAAVVLTTTAMAREGTTAAQMRRAQWLLAVIVAQGALGYLQYARGIPAVLVALHVLGATVVVIAATWFQLGLLDAPGGRQATRQEPLGGATI